MRARDVDNFMDAVLSSVASDAVEWIGNNLDPADVFTTEALKQWATNNDFIKVED